MSSSMEDAIPVAEAEPRLVMRFNQPHDIPDEDVTNSDFVSADTLIDSMDYTTLLSDEQLEIKNFVGLYEAACEAYDQFRPDPACNSTEVFKTYGVPDTFLGAGLYGRVYRSCYPNYAIKYSTALTDFHAKALLQEFAITKTLKMAGVVKSVNVLVHKVNRRRIALVQEFLEGVNLNHAIKQLNCFSEARQVDGLFKKILKIVSKVHNAGFFHNDIKPSNFMYNPDTGSVHLIDFGLAIPLHLETNPRFTIRMLKTGTRLYFPIERLFWCNYLLFDTTFVRLGQAKDSWALGLMFFELMSGGKRLWNSASFFSEEFCDYFSTDLLLKFFFGFPLTDKNSQDGSWMFRNFTLHRLLDLNNALRLTPTELLQDKFVTKYFDLIRA